MPLKSFFGVFLALLVQQITSPYLIKGKLIGVIVSRSSGAESKPAQQGLGAAELLVARSVCLVVGYCSKRLCESKANAS